MSDVKKLSKALTLLTNMIIENSDKPELVEKLAKELQSLALKLNELEE